MTDSVASYDALTRPAHHTAQRVTSLFGLLSGAALIVDTVTIAVINDSFDPLDSILFFTGFVSMLVTLVALAVHLSGVRRGAARVRFGVGVFLVVMAALGAVSFVCDLIGRHVFSPANIGLHGEWSFFSVGVCLLVIAGWTGRPRPRR